MLLKKTNRIQVIITIDGPAASGKSTLSINLACHLKFFCLNSGYLYRGVAYVLLSYYGYTLKTLLNVKIKDIKDVLEGGNFHYEYSQDLVKIFFKDDITSFLKSVDIGKGAAIIAQSMNIRQIIRAYKRKLVHDKDAVVEGRVCGSVVFPNAELKLYVTASNQVRADRFILDQAHRGKDLSKQEALDLLISRDQSDMNRSKDPLVVPKGAVIIDTSNLSQSETLKKVIDLVEDVVEEKY